jgi:hypothetical protein
VKIRISKLDKLFSLFIRERAGGKCEYCGQVKPLQCSHFKVRGKLSVRFDPDNAAGLCVECHDYLENHPTEHAEWFKDRLGMERYELLLKKAEMLVK